MKKLVFLLCLLAATSANADWKFSQERDPMTDVMKSYALCSSETPGGVLMVRCIGGVLEVGYLSDRQFFADTGYVITARRDKERPITFYAEGLNSRTIFAYNPDHILELARRGKTLLIGVTGYNEDHMTVRSFTLKGAKAAIQKVLEACNG